MIVRGETVAVHREIGIGIGDLDASAEPLTFAFEEASLRQARLIAVHAWHIPLAAISRAGSPSPVPDLAATAAEAARRLAGLLDKWRKKYPDVPVSQYVVRDRPSWVLVSLSIRTDLLVIGRHAKPARPARPRFSGARRPEPRARPGRGGPVILIWQSKQLRLRGPGLDRQHKPAVARADTSGMTGTASWRCRGADAGWQRWCMLRHRLSADLGNLVYPDGRSRRAA